MVDRQARRRYGRGVDRQADVGPSREGNHPSVIAAMLRLGDHQWQVALLGDLGQARAQHAVIGYTAGKTDGLISAEIQRGLGFCGQLIDDGILIAGAEVGQGGGDFGIGHLFQLVA